MAIKDVIPPGDADFDTLQEIIVNKCTLNKVAWGISDPELLKLTTKQTLWAAAWLIAKDKQNSTTAQKKAKDLARRQYEKVLRPFIQKWIYRNEMMDDSDVEECGLRPRDTTPTEKQKPATPQDVKVIRGETGELFPECKPVPGAEGYGCVIVNNSMLPPSVTINAQGQFVAQNDDPGPNPMAAQGGLVFAIDLNKSRKKKFTGLQEGVNYYFYFYAYNSAGVSNLSAPVMMKCW